MITPLHHSPSLALNSSKLTCLGDSPCLFWLLILSSALASCAPRNYFTLTILCSHSEPYCVHICTIIIRLALLFRPLIPAPLHSASHRVFVGSSSQCAFHAPHLRGCVGKRTHPFAMTSQSFVCPASRFPNLLLSWYHSLVCCICVLYPPCRNCLRHLLIAVTHSRRISRLELCSGANSLDE
jgi:hypothetical protein